MIIRKVIYETEQKEELLEKLIMAAFNQELLLDKDLIKSIIGSKLDEWRLLFKNSFLPTNKKQE
ncbi:hypothetical protein EOM81_13340 [bacterium]|nr:hypothetical protein [bacterium]